MTSLGPPAGFAWTEAARIPLGPRQPAPERRIGPRLAVSGLVHVALLLVVVLLLAHPLPRETALPPSSFQFMMEPGRSPTGPDTAALPAPLPTTSAPPPQAPPPIAAAPQLAPTAPPPPLPDVAAPETVPPTTSPPPQPSSLAMAPSAAAPPSAVPTSLPPAVEVAPNVVSPVGALPAFEEPPLAPPAAPPAAESPPAATAAPSLSLAPAFPSPPAPPAPAKELPAVRLALAPPEDDGFYLPAPVAVPQPEPESAARPAPPPPPPRAHGATAQRMEITLGEPLTGSIDFGSTPGTDDMIHVRGADLGADWKEKLHQWWQEHATYPTEALRRRQAGTVKIHVRINRDGRVQLVGLDSTSGSQWLDAGAQAVFRGETVPALPPDTPEAVKDIDLTINYILIRR
jgi:TonB family protein